MIQIENIISFIDKYCVGLNNKHWTLECVYEGITNEFEKLKNLKSVTYICVRASIIDVLSDSYEKKVSKSEIIINILKRITNCIKH